MSQMCFSASTSVSATFTLSTSWDANYAVTSSTAYQTLASGVTSFLVSVFYCYMVIHISCGMCLLYDMKLNIYYNLHVTVRL